MKLPLLSMLLPLALGLAPTTQAASCNLCLYGPDNMAFDGGGNLYLVDTDHKTRSRILKLSPQGRRLAEWHVFGVEAGRDNGPDGIALDRAGNVFVVDRGSDRILKLSPAGKVVARFAGFPSHAFDGGGHVAIDSRGNIYGVSAASNLILEFSPRGKRIATWQHGPGAGPDQWNWPESISADENGDLVIDDFRNVRILTLSPEGRVIRAFNSIPNEPLRRASVSGTAVGPDGNIYVADYQLYRIQEFDPRGHLLATIGNTPGNLLFRKAPNSIAVDGQGHLYATDGLSVVKFSREGKLLARWE